MKQRFVIKRALLVCSVYLFSTSALATETLDVPDSFNESSFASLSSSNEAHIDQLITQLTLEQQTNATLLSATDYEAPLASKSSLLQTSFTIDNSDSDMGLFSSNLNSSLDSDPLSRLSLVASSSTGKFRQNGRASWYGGKFHGRKTASGERFNMHAMTAAHRSLPFNTYLKVTNKSNGKSVIVKINDRGPFVGNRIIDLSYGAAKKIGMVQRGVGNVTIEKVPAP